MKVLHIGDFISKNGPSIVDINLHNNFDKDIIKQEQINRNFDFEFLKKLYTSDLVLVSGVSLKGTVAIILMKIFSKKSLFIMHGSLKDEKKFRKVPFKRRTFEKLQIFFSSKIICVSEEFSKKIKETYKKLNKKIDFINNGIEQNIIEINKIKKEKIILTTGGGRKEKGVLNLVKAIAKIEKFKFELVVVGEESDDTEEIRKYNFVRYLNFLNHQELMKLMEEANIFIQNSTYEAFGMAPLEAALRNCKIIVTKEVASRELLLDNTYYCIEDNTNVNEIKDNILKAINGSRLPVFKRKRLWIDVSKEYMEEIKKILRG